MDTLVFELGMEVVQNVTNRHMVVVHIDDDDVYLWNATEAAQLTEILSRINST